MATYDRDGALILGGWAAALVVVFYGPRRCRDLCEPEPDQICQAVCILEPLPWMYAVGAALGVVVTAVSVLWVRRSSDRHALPA